MKAENLIKELHEKVTGTPGFHEAYPEISRMIDHLGEQLQGQLDCPDLDMHLMNFNNFNDIIWRLDLNANFTHVSKSVETILGFKTEEIIGRPVLQFMAPECHEMAIKNIKSTLTNIGNVDATYHEYIFFSKSGERIPMEVSAIPLIDKNKNPIGFTGITRDIRKRKMAEQKAIEAQKQFTMFMDHFPGAAFIKTENEELIYCNKQFASLINQTPEEIIGNKDYVNRIPKDKYDEYRKENKSILTEKKIVVNESSFTSANGETYWLNIKFPMTDAQANNLLGGLSFDITNRKNAEIKLADNESKMSLLAKTATELNLMEPSEDIFEYIADKSYKLIGKSGIVIATDLKDNNYNWSVKAVRGIHAFVTQITRLLGIDVKNMKGSSNPDMINRLKQGNVTELERDLFVLTGGKISQKISLKLLDLLKVKHVYSCIFTQHDKYYGNITILISRQLGQHEIEMLETFIHHVVLTIDKITATKALSESEEKYRLLFEKSASPNIILVGSEFTDVNSKTVELLGYKSKADLIGKKPWQISPEIQPDGQKSIEKAKQIIQKAHQDGFIHFEWVHLKADGTPNWFDISLTLFKKSGEDQIHVIMHNIHEQKTAQDKLEQLNNILADTGRLAKVGGWEFDTKTMRGTWTDEVARIHDMEGLENLSALDGISFYSPQHQPIIKNAVDALINNGTPYDLELELITKKGYTKWVRTKGHPVFENGKVVKAIGSFQDITDLKQAQFEIIKYRDHLEELVKERTTELESKNIELENKNNELEHFNKLFVGREFRIKELKDRIKALENKTTNYQ